MYHENHAINIMGRKIVRNCLRRKGIDFYVGKQHKVDSFNDIMKYDGTPYSVQILVKYPKDNQRKATGKNAEQIKQIKVNSKQANLPYFLLFVDARIGKIYGNSLDYLLEERDHDMKLYPFIEKGIGREIMYFCVDDMKQFGNINSKDLKKLREMIIKNKYHKSQLWLFE